MNAIIFSKTLNTPMTICLFSQICYELFYPSKEGIYRYIYIKDKLFPFSIAIV